MKDRTLGSIDLRKRGTTAITLMDVSGHEDRNRKKFYYKKEEEKNIYMS